MQLPTFTPAEITAALAVTKRKKDAPKDHYYVRDEHGHLVMFYGKPKSQEIGNFFGKKGNARKYDDVDVTVVAYKFHPK